MIGFCVLMLVMAALIWLGSYWISWEIQDVRARPRFAAKISRDCARLLRRGSAPAQAPAPQAAAPSAPAG